MTRRYQILVCRGPECGEKRDAAEVHRELVAELGRSPLVDAEVEVAWQCCFGQCTRGPNVLVREVRPGENSLLIDLMPTAAPGAVLYHGVSRGDVRRIVDEHLQRGRVVAELTGQTGQDR